MNKNHEQVYKEYLSKNAPFYGIFGPRNKQFFAILDENLNVLFHTNKVFTTNGDFSKAIESNIKRFGIQRSGIFKGIRTDKSLLDLRRNLFVKTSLDHHAKLDKTKPVPEQSDNFNTYSKQINYIGVIIDRDEFENKEKQGTYDEYVRSLYTGLGIKKYEEALAWENLGFNNSLIPMDIILEKFNK